MKYNARLKSVLLSSSALMLLTALTINAGAQNITISGDNAQVKNDCRISGEPDPIVTVPEPCATVEYTPQDPYSDSSFASSGDWQHGIIIGKDGSGEVSITDGGTASTAHLVVGHEENASGSVIISGAGSEYVNHASTTVGNAGSGELIIHDGGVYRQVNPDYFDAGYGETGNGYVEVSGVAANGQRSTLISMARINIGNYGTGTMKVLDGGLARSEYTSVMGENINSNGSLLVSGVNAVTGLSSTYKVANNLFWVGYEGHASISVLDGGLVEIHDGFIVGGRQHGKGFLQLDGVNEATGTRSTINSNAFYVASAGEGTAAVTGGSVVNANTLSVGRAENSDGRLVISGIYSPLNYKSSVIINDFGYVGDDGKASLLVEEGGLLSIGTVLAIGYEEHADAVVDIHGLDSGINVTGDASLGRSGKGILNLMDGGTFNSGAVGIAAMATGKGTINIGVGGLSGVVNAPIIRGGLGDATINFNHIDDIDFTPQMAGNLDVNHINTGATTLTTASDYSGLTTISAGALKAGGVNFLSANSDHFVDEFGTLDLNGFGQTLTNLDNGGLVRFGGNGGATLEVSDTYTGNGRVIEFNTVLGDDTSVTDRMKAQETTGSSFVRVKNAGGTGAQTSEGIQLIEIVDPTSTGTFSLLGDYMFEGDQAVVGGAYA
ncbi:autotransporter outer membrane beta-barrel domain-containing protein, partial [Aquamicrobium segne]